MPTQPLDKPVTLDDAPTISLRQLLPGLDTQTTDKSLDETIKVSKLEFILVERSDTSTSNLAAAGTSTGTSEPEWEIPNADTFEEVMGQAIAAFTDIDRDYLNLLEYSTQGWTSGVGTLSLIHI